MKSRSRNTGRQKVQRATQGLADAAEGSTIRVLLGSPPLEVNTVAINCSGERVWLKDSFCGSTRVGVTECCPESAPCPWHQAMGQSSLSIPVDLHVS